MARWLIGALTMFSVLGATAATAQPPDVAQAPAAQVEVHAVTHPLERLTVRVPAAAAYVGGDRFTLYGVADCELHVFAEADAQHRIHRLYWIQFEAYLPSQAEHRYNYAEGNRRIDLAGVPTWVHAGAADAAQPSRPGSDREHVLAILARAGLTPPANLLNVRMVQLPDDPQGTGHGRRELMMIYVEDLAPLGLTRADFLTDGAPNARWTAMEAPLIARASAAFSIERR
jgi:hypothetical protein